MKTMSKVIMLMAVIISFSAVSFAQDPDQTRGPMMGGDMMMGVDREAEWGPCRP